MGADVIHGLDLERLEEHEDLITDRLWLPGRRSGHGVHAPECRGNVVSRIPCQAIRRFTHRGNIVLDPFAGPGTTLIEARRPGRHAIGMEPVPGVAERASQLCPWRRTPITPGRGSWSVTARIRKR